MQPLNGTDSFLFPTRLTRTPVSLRQAAPGESRAAAAHRHPWLQEAATLTQSPGQDSGRRVAGARWRFTEEERPLRAQAQTPRLQRMAVSNGRLYSCFKVQTPRLTELRTHLCYQEGRGMAGTESGPSDFRQVSDAL